MAGIGIIANPHSKLNRRNPKRQELLSYVAGEQGLFKLTQSLDELQSVAQEFKDKDINVLAINGGDGTVNQTINAFIRVYGEKPLPLIALLTGGTMNMLASNLGVKGSPENILYELIGQYSRPYPLNTRNISTLKINDHYGFLFASGTCANFLREFYLNKTGTFGSFKLIARTILGYFSQNELYKKIVASDWVKFIFADGQTFEHDTLSVLLASVERIPLGIKLLPGAMADPKKFALLSLCYQPINLIKKLLWDFFLFPERQSKEKIRFFTEKAEIYFAKEHLYTIDGELFVAKDSMVSVSVGPNIRFIVP